MWTHQTTGQFSALIQSISDELGTREACGVSGFCSCKAIALAFGDAADNGVRKPMWLYPGHKHSMFVFGLGP